MSDRRAEYDAFIRGDVWRAIRKKALAFYGKRCHACRSTENGLHVHHATYTRFGGNERMTDLRILCQSCHEAIHQLHNSNGGSLRATTDAFIAGSLGMTVPEWREQSGKEPKTKRKRKRRKDSDTAPESTERPTGPTGKRACGCWGYPGNWRRQCKTHSPLTFPKKKGPQPCGCFSNVGNWRRLCPEHRAIRDAMPDPDFPDSMAAPGVAPRLAHRPTPHYLNGGPPMRGG
jgi:hypothetical protein